MIKKVGILTLHYVANYGAFLQAYALKEVLKDDLDCEIIDYRNEHKELNYSIFAFIVYCLRKKITKLASLPIILYKLSYARHVRNNLKKDYKKFLELKKQIFKRDLTKLNKKYKAIIIGSDQVWNPDVFKNDYTYLLDFFSNKKYSYASSFGKQELLNSEIDVFKTYLPKFRLISCREECGSEFVNSIVENANCKTVIDPTLLLSRDVWITNFSVDNNNNSSVFLYMTKYNENLYKIAEEYSIYHHRKLIICCHPNSYNKLKNKNIQSDIGVSEWLSLINSSDVIFTNSFHGIIFSAIFNKEFFVNIGIMPSINTTNSRIECLLNLLGLQDRKVSNLGNCISSLKIDYAKVNKCILEKRVESMEYIREVIKDIACK